jgi:hypothetical protein
MELDSILSKVRLRNCSAPYYERAKLTKADMADPLGTTASIIAIIQFSSAIVEYINRVRGAIKERKLLRDEVRACEFILQQLKDDADNRGRKGMVGNDQGA